jgi:hypothetical protein
MIFFYFFLFFLENRNIFDKKMFAVFKAFLQLKKKKIKKLFYWLSLRIFKINKKLLIFFFFLILIFFNVF